MFYEVSDISNQEDYSGYPCPRPFRVSAKAALIKFAPGEFVEPLSVQSLPVETANQLLWISLQRN